MCGICPPLLTGLIPRNRTSYWRKKGGGGDLIILSIVDDSRTSAPSYDRGVGHVARSLHLTTVLCIFQPPFRLVEDGAWKRRTAIAVTNWSLGNSEAQYHFQRCCQSCRPCLLAAETRLLCIITAAYMALSQNSGAMNKTFPCIQCHPTNIHTYQGPARCDGTSALN